jgi:hypothetical protein
VLVGKGEYASDEAPSRILTAKRFKQKVDSKSNDDNEKNNNENYRNIRT